LTSSTDQILCYSTFTYVPHLVFSVYDSFTAMKLYCYPTLPILLLSFVLLLSA